MHIKPRPYVFAHISYVEQYSDRTMQLNRYVEMRDFQDRVGSRIRSRLICVYTNGCTQLPHALKLRGSDLAAYCNPVVVGPACSLNARCLPVPYAS